MVTGIGIVSPIGSGVTPYWQALVAGKTGIVPFDGVAGSPRVAAPIPKFSVREFVPDERLLRVCSRSFELLLAAASLGARDASLNDAPLDRSRVGVAIGIGPIDQCSPELCEICREAASDDDFLALAAIARAAQRLHPLRRLRHLPNTAASVVSISLNAGGPSMTIVTGVTSAMQALLVGDALIRDGRADVMLCGGADAPLTPVLLSMWNSRCPLSPCPEPDLACRPFDRSRTGAVAGEGAAVLVLEGDDSCNQRGGRPYAEFVGGWTSAGSLEWANVLRRHGGRGDRPDAFVAHGEGGTVSDAAEANDIARAFPHVPPPITCVQAAVGHTFAAAGAFAAATACLMLSHRAVPPIRSLADPIRDLPFVTGGAREIELRSVQAQSVDPAGARAVVTFGAP